MGQFCPIKCTPILSTTENTVLQWAFELTRHPAAAKTWHLKSCTQKVKYIIHFVNKVALYVEVTRKSCLTVSFNTSSTKYFLYTQHELSQTVFSS
jgi:hypothetical protein